MIVGASVVLGCSSGSSLSSVTCEQEQDCPDPDTECIRGYCVLATIDDQDVEVPEDRDVSDEDIISGDLDATLPDVAPPEDTNIPVPDAGCPEDLEECGAHCVDLQTSTNHCGDCSNACEVTFVCVEGQCVDQCTDQQTRCGLGCVNTTSNPLHCGECARVCTDTPEGEEPICVESECTFTCPDEHRPCVDVCVPDDASQQVCGDACVDVLADPDHCGGCGSGCEQAPENGLRLCEEGDCVIHCQEGYQFCGDQCLGPDDLCQICEPDFEGPFGGGFGTESSPYLICDLGHLELLTEGSDQYLSASFLLTEDLELAGQFAMIGSHDAPFTGRFDGGGHTLSSLEISASEQSLVGLFRAIGGQAVITELIIDVEEILGDADVGALAGRSAGWIEQVEVRGAQVQGRQSVGGLVGNNGGTIMESQAHLERVTSLDVDPQSGGPTNDAGGIVGFNLGTIDGAWSTATVSNPDGLSAGGISGFNAGTVTRARSHGVVEGSLHVGGLVGYNLGVIENSYALGHVSGDEHVGGLVGSLVSSQDSPDSALRRGYAAASVEGDQDVGALVGARGSWQGGPDMVDLYWDQQVMAEGGAIGSGAAGGTVEITGLETDQFGNADNLEHLDFEAIWEIGTIEGVARPRLRWQP